jgi:hypothetical protein
MPNVLTFVDDTLARQIATGLIGSEVRLTTREGTARGINFKVLIQRDRSTEQSKTTRIAELLPETVAEAIREVVEDRIDNLEASRERLIAGSKGAFRPGSTVLVGNAQISLETKQSHCVLSGEDCVQYRLQQNGFYLHAYCSKNAEPIFDSFSGQPVEVVGILRYTPAYAVPGALSLSLGLRVCAVWLR